MEHLNKVLGVLEDGWSQGYRKMKCAARPPLAGNEIVYVAAWRDTNGKGRTAITDERGRVIGPELAGSNEHKAVAEAAGYRLD